MSKNFLNHVSFLSYLNFRENGGGGRSCTCSAAFAFGYFKFLKFSASLTGLASPLLVVGLTLPIAPNFLEVYQ